jgi:hypothetical protein
MNSKQSSYRVSIEVRRVMILLYTRLFRSMSDSNTLEVSNRLDIARAVGPSSNMNIVEGKIRATAISTQNIVVFSLGLSSAEDVGHRDVLDDDTVCGTSGWSSVEVVLLDVDTVDVDVRDLDITVLDVGCSQTECL